MNNPNPLIPQGSLLEQQAKGKPHLRIALIIVAVHVVFLGLLLMQGCKREDEPQLTEGRLTNEPAIGWPDPSTLFPTNESSELDVAQAQEPVMTPMEPGPGVPELPETLAGAGSTSAIPPTPRQDPEIPTPPSQREHTVVRGDTFFTIGRQYDGVTATDIARANPNVNPNRLQIGQKLIIPPPAPEELQREAAALPEGVELYAVKAGDTLTAIARKYATTVPAIRQLNGMTTDRIYVGQKLKLPARTNTVTNPQNP